MKPSTYVYIIYIYKLYMCVWLEMIGVYKQWFVIDVF